jgi:chromatin modification-related protein YNG2
MYLVNNLPLEVAHILEEIGDKDVKFYETRKRIQQRDNQIHKYIRAHGSLADNPKEEPAYPKIRADFEKAMALQQQKLDLSHTGLYVVAKELKKLNTEINRLENDGLLAPANPDILSTDTSRQASVAASSSRVRASAAAEKRNSPAPSRSATPGSRPNKRQKVESASPPSVSGFIDGEEEEVLYCFCQQVSFGNMVACDNPDCQYEWFHYGCVGLSSPPSGSWYCPSCAKERKEKDFKDTKKRR